MHSLGIRGSKGPGAEHNTQASQKCMGAQPRNTESDKSAINEAQTHLTATGVQSTHPAEVLLSHPRAALGLANLGARAARARAIMRAHGRPRRGAEQT